MKSAFRTTLLAAATLAAFGASSAFAAGRPDLVAQGLAQGKDAGQGGTNNCRDHDFVSSVNQSVLESTRGRTLRNTAGTVKYQCTLLDMSDTFSTSDHRTRLLDALTQALSEKSYAELTIADIVARAHVSRRTFYQQFEHKDACLLALCERLSENVLGLIVSDYDPMGDWQVQLKRVTDLYLQALQAQPTLVRTLYIELMQLGAVGLAMRRRIGQRFALFLAMQVEMSRLREPSKRSLTPTLATAIVGGVNELILQAVEEGRADRLGELAPTVSEFVQAVLKSLEAPAA